MSVFLRTVSLFWKYWPRALVAYFCLIAGAALALLIPRLTGQAIDLALTSGQQQALVLTALAVGAAGILRSGVGYYQSYLAEFIAQRVAYDLRKSIYDRLQRLSYAFHDRSQTGQLMSRATVDVEAVRQFVGFALLRGVYFLVLMVAITVLLFRINWQLALLSLSVLPFISYRTVIIGRQLRTLWIKIQQGVGDLGTIIQENLTGVRVVRAFAREDYENGKFRRQADLIYSQEMEANNLLALNSPAQSFALFFAMAAVLWYGGQLVVSNALTHGELAQFLLYLVMLTMPVRMLGWLAILFSRATASGKRIFEILDQASPVVERPGATEVSQIKGLVRFENVSFSYDSQGTVLRDVSFEAQPGQIIALVGASGSGKSTIANLLPRFYDVTSGRITIDGVDIRDMTLASLRQHIGIVHQDTFLFSASIKDNLTYGRPEATMDEVMAAAKVARLHDFITGLPDGYETWVGERGITLSGGQKQRLAIARTLLLDPKILIMDDSTSNVDTETEYLIQQALAELPAGRTTFIIAHRLRSVQRADLILVLKHGQVIDRGTHDELLAKEGPYRQLYSIQFELQEPSDLVAQAPQVEAAVSPEVDEVKVGGARAGRSSLESSDDIVYGKPYDSRVVSRMAKYFAPYKVALPLTIIATLVYTGTIVASPYLVGVAVNSYIVAANLAGLNLIVLAFLGNAALNSAAYYTQIRAEAKLGQSILLNLRSQLFDHLQRLSIRFFDHNAVGRLMSRVQNDVEELGEFLDSGAFWVAGQIVSLFAIIFIVLALDLHLALLTLSSIPLLILFLAFWQSRARRSFINVRQAISAVNSALQENISGVRVVQSLSREDLNSKQFDEVNYAHFRATLRAAMTSATMMPAVEMLVSLATALVILYGGIGVLSGTLLVGTLLAFVLYIQTFFDPIRALSVEYAQLQRAMASGSRVFELLDVPEEPSLGDVIKTPALKGDISFENVSFSYDPDVEVLHEVNLQVAAGRTVALVGPTGAGKSTIISLVTRFYDVTSGRILVDGYDLRRLDKTSYRRQLGLVLQDPFLFSGTIRENIRYGNLDATDTQVIAAAKAVGLHEFIIGLEKGYDTHLQERGQNLSTGQRQLISFARALAANPAILLLDEATASVDSHSERLLQAGLRSLMRGRTTLVIAHRLSTVQDADLIVVLDRGRIVEQGKHEELVGRGGLYTRLYEMTYARLASRVT